MRTRPSVVCRARELRSPTRAVRGGRSQRRTAFRGRPKLRRHNAKKRYCFHAGITGEQHGFYVICSIRVGQKAIDCSIRVRFGLMGNCLIYCRNIRGTTRICPERSCRDYKIDKLSVIFCQDQKFCPGGVLFVCSPAVNVVQSGWGLVVSGLGRFRGHIRTLSLVLT